MNKLAALALVALAGTASAATVDVNYSVSGGPGLWTLDFNVTNNIPAPGVNTYFFGVELATGGNIVGSPAGYDPTAWPTWDNSGYGGSSTVYNNNWIDFSFAGPTSQGGSLGGFQALYTGATAPTSVNFFMFAFDVNGGSGYTGDDAFYDGANPGFEGTAHEVPAPGALAAFGIAGLVATRRRR